MLSEKGIKQTWLAEKLGKNFRTVNLYVTNAVQPPIPVLFEIAELLNVTPQELLVDDLAKEQKEQI